MLVSGLLKSPHKSRRRIARPHKNIPPPAIACMDRSVGLSGKNRKPNNAKATHDSIVSIVLAPKIKTTLHKLSQSLEAAGYITSGISTSQGPNMKIVKRTHGVKLCEFPCRCR